MPPLSEHTETCVLASFISYRQVADIVCVRTVVIGALLREGADLMNEAIKTRSHISETLLCSFVEKKKKLYFSRTTIK